jgi:hypothetical protein
MFTDPETVQQAELEAAQEHAESYERCFRNVTWPCSGFQEVLREASRDCPS